MQASRTLVDKPLEQVIRDARTVERLGMCWGVVEGSREVADAARAAVEQDSTLRHTGSYGSAIEVVDARASKGSALAWLCDRLGIAREQRGVWGLAQRPGDGSRGGGRRGRGQRVRCCLPRETT